MKLKLNLFILIKLTYSVVVSVLTGFAEDIEDFLDYAFLPTTKFEVICDLGIFDKTEEGRFITSSVFDDKFSAVDYYKTIFPNIITVTPVRDYNLGVGVDNFHSAPFLSGESSYHTFCVIRSNENSEIFVPNKNFIMNESLKYHYLPSMNGNFVLPGFYYAFKLKIQVIEVVHNDMIMSRTSHNTHHYLLFYDHGGSFNSDINSGLAKYQDDSPVNVVTFCKWGPKYRIKSMRYHINSESVYCPSPILTYDFKVASVSSFELSLDSLSAPELQIIKDFLNYESLENLNGDFVDCEGIATDVFYIPAETNACYVDTNLVKLKCNFDLQTDTAVAIDDSYQIGDICWSSYYNTYFLIIGVFMP